MARHIQLLTFDLDNTLWDVEPVIIRAEQRLHAWLEMHAPAALSLYSGEDRLALRDQVLRDHPHLLHDLSRLREEILYYTMRRSQYEEAEARRLAQAAFHHFLDARHDVDFFPGALDLLERLARDYRLAALSNGNADIGRLGLGEYFEFSVSAASVGASKPMPDMFHAALDKAGCSPSAVIHIGDNLEHDVAGAGAVGMHTIWVNLLNQQATTQRYQPTATVTTLDQITQVVTDIDAQMEET